MNRSPINNGNLAAPRTSRVIVLENLNFLWDLKELNVIAKMWKKGKSVESIAEHFDRDPDEILLACIHLARKDKISRRNGGLKGVCD